MGMREAEETRGAFQRWMQGARVSPCDIREYRFRDWVVRDGIIAALVRWVEDAVPPGGFLTAVLSNNLRDACGLADDDMARNLPGVVAWLYNVAPSGCWGSAENFAEWAKGYGLSGRGLIPGRVDGGADGARG